jgi:hypothetical protein
MNNFKEKLHTEILKIRLSERERGRILARIKEAGRVPAYSQRNVKSPYRFGPRSLVAVSLIGALALGSATAYAAEGTFPGDILYPIKINVNEKIVGALALSDTAKAKWATTVTERRIEEAETLTANGKLTEEAKHQIQSNFDQNANTLADITTKLDDSDPAEAAELSVQFNSSLNAHKAILTRLSEESDDQGSKQLSLAFSEHLGEHANSSRGASVSQTMAFTTASSSEGEGRASTSPTFFASVQKGEATETPESSQTLERLKNSASESLKNAVAQFNLVKDSLDPGTSARIEAGLMRIEAEISGGTSVQGFSQALREASTLYVFLKASKKFNKNLFTPFSPREDMLNNGGRMIQIQNTEGNHAEIKIKSSGAASTTEGIKIEPKQNPGQPELNDKNKENKNSNSDQNQGGKGDDPLHDLLDF